MVSFIVFVVAGGLTSGFCASLDNKQETTHLLSPVGGKILVFLEIGILLPSRFNNICPRNEFEEHGAVVFELKISIKSLTFLPELRYLQA